MGHQHKSLAEFVAQALPADLPENLLGALLLDIATIVIKISEVTTRGGLDNLSGKLSSQNIQG